MTTINNKWLIELKRVRESADILSTRIRMDLLCVYVYVCLLVCVWLNRTVSLLVSRYLICYCLTSFFIVSSNDATHRERSPYLSSTNSLIYTLIAPRAYSPMLTERQRYPASYSQLDTKITYWIGKRIARFRCDQKSSSASPFILHECHKYYRVVLQVVQTSINLHMEFLRTFQWTLRNSKIVFQILRAISFSNVLPTGDTTSH